MGVEQEREVAMQLQENKMLTPEHFVTYSWCLNSNMLYLHPLHSVYFFLVTHFCIQCASVYSAFHSIFSTERWNVMKRNSELNGIAVFFYIYFLEMSHAFDFYRLLFLIPILCIANTAHPRREKCDGYVFFSQLLLLSTA